MPPTETVERSSIRDAALAGTRPLEPGVGSVPEPAVPETLSVEKDVPVWIVVAVVAVFAAMTVAWVGALGALTAWIIRSIL